MIKYLFFSDANGVSDVFPTFEECEQAALKETEEFNTQCSIYCYDGEEEDFGVEDCSYIAYTH